MLVLSLLGSNFLGDGTRVKGQAVVVADAAQLRNLLRARFQPQQAQHLAVAVLIHDIYALVTINKLMNFRSKGESPQAAIAGVDIMLAPQLVKAFLDGPVAGAVGDDAH